jgi:hypothetical protein
VRRQLELGGARDELVCVRRSGVAVFRGPGRFLRLVRSLASFLESGRFPITLGHETGAGP